MSKRKRRYVRNLRRKFDNAQPEPPPEPPGFSEAPLEPPEQPPPKPPNPPPDPPLKLERTLIVILVIVVTALIGLIFWMPLSRDKDDPLAILNELDTNNNGRISCAEARAAGITPVYKDHFAYRFMHDADRDGMVCE